MKSITSTANKRWRAWLPLLGVAAWLAFFGDKTPSASEATVSAPTRPASEPPNALSAQNVQVARAAASEPANNATPILMLREQLIPARSKDAPPRDLFAARSWNPPPPSPPPPQAQAPVAPPLPFSYLGRKVEGEDWEVYLARGDQTFVAKAGTVLDGAWRVETAQPPALVLTYLPLGLTQTLPIGDRQ